MSSYPVVEISIEPIELCKLLKIANMVGGGGEAKIVISEGYVLVNNEVEYQKRKKIRRGDIVEFDGESFVVAFKAKKKSANAISPKTSVTTKTVKKKKSLNKASEINDEQVFETSSERPKRRPISF